MNTISAITYVSTFKANQCRQKTYTTEPTIKKYHKVDDTLLRGAKPTQAQLSELKNSGVKTIISFCTNYNPKNPNVSTKPDEANWAQKLGMKFYWMPFRSIENPPEQYIRDFFDITDAARKNGEKVFIHCRHGADRTGVFAAMYKLRNQYVKLSDVISELLRYGHDANHNQNIIPFLIDYESSLNPLRKLLNFIKQPNLISQILKEISTIIKKGK